MRLAAPVGRDLQLGAQKAKLQHFYSFPTDNPAADMSPEFYLHSPRGVMGGGGVTALSTIDSSSGSNTTVLHEISSAVPPQVSVEMDMSKPDLAAALKDIRSQYENLSARNQAQAEEWYRSKFASVTEVAARNQDAIKHSKEELSEYRRQVQARTLEIEALRGHNEALERQIAEMEDRHNSELGDMQVSRSG